jgi:hypothetical protein
MTIEAMTTITKLTRNSSPISATGPRAIALSKP